MRSVPATPRSWSPLDFLRIPLIALVGWLFYGEALDPFVFVGAAVIIAGVVWNLRAEARRWPVRRQLLQLPASALVPQALVRGDSHFGQLDGLVSGMTAAVPRPLAAFD